MQHSWQILQASQKCVELPERLVPLCFQLPGAHRVLVPQILDPEHQAAFFCVEVSLQLRVGDVVELGQNQFTGFLLG